MVRTSAGTPFVPVVVAQCCLALFLSDAVSRHVASVSATECSYVNAFTKRFRDF